MKKLMTAEEFVAKLIDIATNFITLYVLGSIGAKATEENKRYYIGKNDYNAGRADMIRSAEENTWFFDCVCLIKAILWGWIGDLAKAFGGTVYASNGVPDVDDTEMFEHYCYDHSTDFSRIVLGEAVWHKGHIGVYIGDGLAVECTPSWDNGVQITAVGNIGSKHGYNTQTWTAHAKLPWINYDSAVLNGLVKDGNQYYLYKAGKLINSPGEHFVDGWYHIHNDGRIAMGEDVWVPYVFADEDKWDDEQKKQVANAVGGEEEWGPYLYKLMKNKLGKWVRYDGETGKMVYGASIKNNEFYYFEPHTGAMVKDEEQISFLGCFDPVTGIMTNIHRG